MSFLVESEDGEEDERCRSDLLIPAPVMDAGPRRRAMDLVAPSMVVALFVTSVVFALDYIPSVH